MMKLTVSLKRFHFCAQVTAGWSHTLKLFLLNKHENIYFLVKHNAQQSRQNNLCSESPLRPPPSILTKSHSFHQQRKFAQLSNEDVQMLSDGFHFTENVMLKS